MSKKRTRDEKAQVDSILKELNENYLVFKDLKEAYEDDFADLDPDGDVMKLWNKTMEALRALKNRLVEISNGDAESDKDVYSLWQKARKYLDLLENEFMQTMVNDREKETFKNDFIEETDVFYQIGDEIYYQFVDLD